MNKRIKIFEIHTRIHGFLKISGFFKTKKQAEFYASQLSSQLVHDKTVGEFDCFIKEVFYLEKDADFLLNH